MATTNIWTAMCAAAAFGGFLVGATTPLPAPQMDVHALHGPTLVVAQPALLPEQPNS